MTDSSARARGAAGAPAPPSCMTMHAASYT